MFMLIEFEVSCVSSASFISINSNLVAIHGKLVKIIWFKN